MRSRKVRLEKVIASFEGRLEKNFNMRLGLSVVYGVGLVAAAAFPEANIGLPLSVLFFVPFLYLLRKTAQLKKLLKKLKTLKAFYQRQIDNINGSPSRSDLSLAPENTLAHDLDLEGPRSLFALLDETITVEGAQRLKAELSPSKRTIDELKLRQKRITDLAGVAPSLVKWIVSSKALIDKDAEYRSFSRLIGEGHTLEISRAFRSLVYISFFGLILLIGLTAAEVIGTEILSYYWLYFFILSMISLKGTGASFSFAQSLEALLPFQMAYVGKAQRLAEDGALSDLCTSLSSHKPKSQFSRLERLSSLLSVQSHPLLLIFINGVLPWNLFFAERLEKLIGELKPVYKGIEEELVELEFYSCLALVYYFQSRVFPELSTNVEFSATDIYHPLLKRNDAIKNSLEIGSDQRLNVITGSNMSGKSTFLRTLGINQVLAMMGAPVFATSMKTFTGLVHSCVRVSDSVEYGYSYFYSEVRRVKNIIDSAKSDVPILYLIDEIFKGTNNYERLEGSKGVLRALGKSQSLGFVSTHDLELTKIDEPESTAMNWHFKEDIENGEMVFDYTLREGPSPSTNALKIMADAGLPVKI